MAVLLRLKQTVRTLLLLDRNMRLILPVDNGAFQSPDKAGSLSECINLMPYTSETRGASSSGQLSPVDGLAIWNTAIPDRTFTFEIKGDIYGCWNNSIYQLDYDGNPTLVATGFSTVTFTDTTTWGFNGEVVCFCFPEYNESYFWDISLSTVSKITDVVFAGYEAQDGGVLAVTSIDGYFVYCTKQDVFKSSLVSAPDKGTGFDALDYAQAEFSPDTNVTVGHLHGELYVFGQLTIEIWSNVGGVGFPFQRIDGATIEKGLGFGFADPPRKLDNSFIFIGAGEGESYSVWQVSGGGSAKKLSTKYIDELIATVQSTTFSYQKGGKFFYGTTTSDGTCFLDLTATALTQIPAWHKRQISPIDSDSLGNLDLSRWGPEIGITYGHEKIIVDGRYYLDSNTFSNTSYVTDYSVFPFPVTEETNPTTRIFTAPYLQGEGDDVYVSRVELRMKTAVGDSSASSEADRNPTVLMEVSDDQGRSWNSFGSRAIGRSGKTRTQVVWNRGCGRSPNYRLFRFTTINSIETVFLDLVLDVERANH